MDRPFLQTPEWLAFQKSLGRRVWRLDDGFIKANVIRHDVRLGQNYLYVPYGPELNFDLAKQGLTNEISHFVSHIRALAEHEGSMFVKLEPMHDVALEILMRNGMRMRKARGHIQPMRTVVMDLDRSSDDLLDGLHHKHRYNINLAQRKGVTVGDMEDVSVFWSLLQQTSEHDDFRTHDRRYYGKLMSFFSGEHSALRTRMYGAFVGGKPIAAAIILEHGRTAYYLHGAMDRTYRALMAPHALHWSVIQQYKERGFAHYDFWGIDAHLWPGVTRFKLGFGAQTVEYPGSFDLVTKPMWYWLYRHLPR